MRREKNKDNHGDPVRFIDHPDLHRTRKVRAFLEQAQRIIRSGDGYRPMDEGVLFRALNACRSRLNCKKQSNRHRAQVELERYRRLHSALIAFLVQRNVGLVYDMIRRTRIVGVDRDELVSEGMWTLLKAVTRFDPWRGFRFSTYACTSILRAYVSLGRKQQRDRQAIANLRERAVPSETRGESAVDLDIQVAKDQLGRILDRNSAQLTDLERFVIERRVLHNPGTKADTLTQVGTMVELSKERVRQIQRAALTKLEQALCDAKSVPTRSRVTAA